jgi:hypothetical protein
MINKNQFCEVHLLDDGTYLAEFIEGDIITHDAHYETLEEMESSCENYIKDGLFEMSTI